MKGLIFIAALYMLVPLTAQAAEQITSGLYHSCLRSAGKVYCWGHGGQGQIGNGQFDNQSLPTRVKNIPGNVIQISTGAYHNCALNHLGDTYCWGYNYSGQLATGYARTDIGFPSFSKTPEGLPKYAKSIPQKVSTIPRAIKLASSYSTTCALTREQSVYCWGDGRYMQLGDGVRSFTNASEKPKKASVLKSKAIKDIYALYKSFCVVTEDSSTLCFGLSTHDFISSIKLTKDIPQSKWNSISAGDSHACAVDSLGKLWCIGQGWYAQVMDEDDLEKWSLRQTGFSTIAVSAKKKTTCVLSAKKSVYCWGLCINGQCGKGSVWTNPQDGQNPALFTSAKPKLINGLPKIAEISVGATHVCALSQNGQIYCWGQGFLGQIGNGKTTTVLSPQLVY